MACGCKNKAAAAAPKNTVTKSPSNGVVKTKTTNTNRVIKREIR